MSRLGIYMHAIGREDEVPIFVSASKLLFRGTEDKQAHMLSMYNPYNFEVKFKVLCTLTRNYTVTHTTGIIKGKCRLDIVVRCILRPMVGTIGKLKIEAYNRANKPIQPILVELWTVPHDYVEKEERGMETPVAAPQPAPVVPVNGNGGQGESLNIFLICAAAILSIVLMFPTLDEPGSERSIVPTICHPTVYQKMISCFILGAIADYIIRR